MSNQLLTDFGNIFLFILVGVIFALGGLFTAMILRPRRPGEEKLTTYESGEDPIGSAWGSFNIRFYIVALIFLLFEVEILFLFPWATVFGDPDKIESTNGIWGWFALVEIFLFVGILILGLAYVWRKGFLDWVKPSNVHQAVEKQSFNKAPYEQFNKKYINK
ncbi:NADH-quinone oxidoreductase subunit A [Flammeovirga kamogawensis]|uniref:NADH-quinone oxidoreductase subunit A n=1 Tax=Flammeovirga kamogawensis TaxID=373891 RepID=A0ABX8GQG3_9BACT|nr:NADH-quinone oxidoreductase subunit A [Flammeovirga kamogawensis]MBB6462079.1 NADH-quinone oxidoreductase subunit A [Flammeovirga kamogawensis]QWG05815.1 NADH-quinone oxidoreductase subunit A [Flammeovirga kamogawensis]TRX67642.1 NADH-quinone oxidoreductase subunit A [Flammeovirga kamogawensis]